MNKHKPVFGSAFAFSAALGILTLIHGGEPATAAPLSAEAPALAASLDGAHLAQAAGEKREPAPRPAKPESKPRAAASKAVTVSVLMLSDLPGNPDETIEANGTRYIYFNSKQLVSPARPLADLKPRYPSGKLSQQDGAVILQLLINEKGELDQVNVVCAAPPFEKSARDSLRGARFAPARSKDGPVKSYMLAEFGYGRGYPCTRVPD